MRITHETETQTETDKPILNVNVFFSSIGCCERDGRQIQGNRKIIYSLHGDTRNIYRTTTEIYRSKMGNDTNQITTCANWTRVEQREREGKKSPVAKTNERQRKIWMFEWMCARIYLSIWVRIVWPPVQTTLSLNGTLFYNQQIDMYIHSTSNFQPYHVHEHWQYFMQFESWTGAKPSLPLFMNSQ